MTKIGDYATALEPDAFRYRALKEHWIRFSKVYEILGEPESWAVRIGPDPLNADSWQVFLSLDAAVDALIEALAKEGAA